MKRTTRAREPWAPRVLKVALKEGGTRWRWALVIVLILTAIGAFGYGITHIVNKNAGWRVISTQDSAEANCGGEFTLRYALGRTGENPSLEYRRVADCYTKAAVAAYRVYHRTELFEGCHNLAWLNAHPNEIVSVEPALYSALETLSDSRYAYLAPVYETYRGVFSCVYDTEAEQFDPRANATQAEEAARFAAFAADPASVDVELLGGGQVRLNVSDEYMRSADAIGVTTYVDFFWLTNAFVADDIAEALIAQGYTAGTLTSYDGYIRNLDASGTEYAINLFERQDAAPIEVGTLTYTPPMNLMRFDDYPTDELDALRYYRWEDGRVSTPYIDGKDGLDRCAVGSLLVYSASESCAEIALAAAKSYIADDLDEQALAALASQGIYAVWSEGDAVYQTQADARITQGYSAQ